MRFQISATTSQMMAKHKNTATVLKESMWAWKYAPDHTDDLAVGIFSDTNHLPEVTVPVVGQAVPGEKSWNSDL